MRRLGPVADIPDGGTLAFDPPDGAFYGLFALRRGDDIRVYVNSCPHIGTPLDWAPGRFLAEDRSAIVCAIHGARFRLDDGVCTAGPCLGDRLEPVVMEIRDGILFVAEDAGS